MPIINSKNSMGTYYKWGKNGFKYYYIKNNEKSRMRAKEKALRQGRAIKANQMKGGVSIIWKSGDLVW